jgi:hypothetical protein
MESILYLKTESRDNNTTSIKFFVSSPARMDPIINMILNKKELKEKIILSNKKTFKRCHSNGSWWIQIVFCAGNINILYEELFEFFMDIPKERSEKVYQMAS